MGTSSRACRRAPAVAGLPSRPHRRGPAVAIVVRSETGWATAAATLTGMAYGMARFVQTFPPLPDVYAGDHVLRATLVRLLGEVGHKSAAPLLEALAAEVAGHLRAAHTNAETHPPILRRYDAWGRRVDEVATAPGRPAHRAARPVRAGRWPVAAPPTRARSPPRRPAGPRRRSGSGCAEAPPRPRAPPAAGRRPPQPAPRAAARRSCARPRRAAGPAWPAARGRRRRRPAAAGRSARNGPCRRPCLSLSQPRSPTPSL